MAENEAGMGGAAPAIERPGLSEAELERRRGKPWTLRVVGSADVGPRMRRVQLTADNLDGFEPKPGQEIVLHIPQAGEPARRHYTIRRYDAKTRLIDVDFVLHDHDTPGVQWAREARPGQSIDIRGPRGRIGLASADWHLLTGDETAIPAILAVLEALPAGAKAHVFIEIGSDADKQEVKSAASVILTWVSRKGVEPGPSHVMLKVVQGFALPPGRGSAIVIGETSNVRAQRHDLIARGMERGQIFAEGYWRPGRIGGHDHVDRE
jgi:NADPH-dependent ferric siderophore reductase